MAEIPDNVHMQVLNLIPASIINKIACFVFYDNHPKDRRNVDITICTKNGELIEFFQRDVISTIDLKCSTAPVDIKIIRNSSIGLCYLVGTKGQLYIVSSKDKLLNVFKILTNIHKYDIIDTSCSGRGFLQVFVKDDAVPIFFDDQFERLEDGGAYLLGKGDEDTLPIINKLQEKLVEAKYTKNTNEQTLKEYLNIRQNVTLLTCQNLHPNLNDSIFKNDSINVSGELKINVLKPYATVCNKKLVLILNAINRYYDPTEDIHILLHTATLMSISYTTKIFTKIPSSPFWQENDSNSIKPGQESAVVAVIDLDQVKQNVTSNIEVSGAISYTISNKENILPFDDVLLSSLKSIGDEFDVLSNSGIDSKISILAILATTEKNRLCLREIKNQDEPRVPLQELLCSNLQMEKIAHNMIVYRKSPYHLLNGVMIIFMDDCSGISVSVSVHTRCPSQVLALLHCINDAVPSRIVATTPNYSITAKIDELAMYNDDPIQLKKSLNYKDYATSLLNRTTKILDHLNSSMIKMAASNDPGVRSKVGSNIDLFAGGVENFKDFRNDILKEAKRGIDRLLNADGCESSPDSDVMIID